MKKKRLHLKSRLALSVVPAFFCLNQPAAALSTPAQDSKPVQDRDTTRQELARFDQFLDSHREIAAQLRKNPSLVDDQEFVKNHPALQTYLQDHPGVREEIKKNPKSFMQAENRYDRQEDNRDRDANRDRDTTRQELASFDKFLDSHRETADQLRKDPSLVDNKEFVKNHPALQTYLQDHPRVREEIKENPNSFMRAENRYDHQEASRFDRREDSMNRDMDRDAMHRHFGEFLDDHSDVAERLSKDPSLVKNQEFMDGHPELKEYLKAHPEARQELMANPQSFLKSSQQFSTKNPPVQPKPKQ